jgi:hypothetical protein
VLVDPALKEALLGGLLARAHPGIAGHSPTVANVAPVTHLPRQDLACELRQTYRQVVGRRRGDGLALGPELLLLNRQFMGGQVVEHYPARPPRVICSIEYPRPDPVSPSDSA